MRESRRQTPIHPPVGCSSPRLRGLVVSPGWRRKIECPTPICLQFAPPCKVLLTSSAWRLSFAVNFFCSRLKNRIRGTLGLLPDRVVPKKKVSFSLVTKTPRNHFLHLGSHVGPVWNEDVFLLQLLQKASKGGGLFVSFSRCGDWINPRDSSQLQCDYSRKEITFFPFSCLSVLNFGAKSVAVPSPPPPV